MRTLAYLWTDLDEEWSNPASACVEKDGAGILAGPMPVRELRAQAVAGGMVLLVALPNGKSRPPYPCELEAAADALAGVEDWPTAAKGLRRIAERMREAAGGAGLEGADRYAAETPLLCEEQRGLLN